MKNRISLLLFGVLLLTTSFILTGCSKDDDSEPIVKPIAESYIPDYDNGDTIYINVKIGIDRKGWNSKSAEYFRTELTKQWQQITDRFNNCDKKHLLKRHYVFHPDVNDIIVYDGCSYWGENGANTKMINKIDKNIFKLCVIYDFFYQGSEAGEYGGGCGDDDGIGTILIINATDENKNVYSNLFDENTYRAITHELGHYRGVTDLYIDVVEAQNNAVNHEGFSPIHCLMNDYCYTPDAESCWSDYAIKIINKTGNEKKAGFIENLMHDDFADSISFTASKAGKPVDATLKFYAATYSYVTWSNEIGTTPVRSMDLKNGALTIDARNLFYHGTDIWDHYHLLLVEADLSDGTKLYHWIPDYELHNAGMDGVKTYPIQFESK
jgi:hypothetical protein